MPQLTDEERIGTKLAEKYRLDAIVGRGAMGVVFSATHEWTHRRVAVKLLHPEHARNAEAIQRFLKEARAATTLRHRNVVDVLDMGEHDGTVYLALEFLEGESLADRLTKLQKLSLRDAYAILLPVMDAVATAHRAGIVHRDLKPENIYLARQPDGAEIPKVLDFGIAKFNEGNAQKATQTGTVIGTPAYIAPEQAMASPHTGPAADVWSMGAVWFECLSGQTPFTADTVMALLLTITSSDGAPPLQTRSPETPAMVCAAIDRALRKDLQQRYPTMEAFTAALRASWNENGTTVPLSTGEFPTPAFTPSLMQASWGAVAHAPPANGVIPAPIVHHSSANLPAATAPTEAQRDTLPPAPPGTGTFPLPQPSGLPQQNPLAPPGAPLATHSTLTPVVQSNTPATHRNALPLAFGIAGFMLSLLVVFKVLNLESRPVQRIDPTIVPLSPTPPPPPPPRVAHTPPPEPRGPTMEIIRTDAGVVVRAAQPPPRTNNPTRPAEGTGRRPRLVNSW